MGKSELSRRRVLAAALGVGTTGLLAKLGTGMSFAGTDTDAQAAAVTPAGGTLPVPELLVGDDEGGVKVFRLEMKNGGTDVIAGTTSPTAGFNRSFLGPTIRIANGDDVRFEVTNHLGAQSTVHWHGLHVAPSNDGGPQNVIADGGTWTPSLPVIQQACTLWYHPHGLGTTASQVSLGLAGMIIVDDGSAANAALPHDYGADDFPLILQSTAITSTGALASTNGGFTGAGSKLQFLVNGASATAATPTVVAARNRLRFRPLNASLTDTITITRTDGATFTQVASDAGLLPAPLPVTSLKLVPGERAEIVIDLTSGETVNLQATPKTAAGANRYTVSMLQITTTGTDTPAPLPGTLNPLMPLDTTGANTRTLTLAATGGQQTINGIAGTSVAAMHANMLMVGLNDVEVWDVVNGTTGTYHSFHLHDVPFQVLSIGGNAPTGPDAGWKDTIEVPPSTTVRIAMKFTDFTDTEYMYMLHCHNLPHEDAGMMLGLMVTGP